MPDTPSPGAAGEADALATELNFSEPTTTRPRLKRRSLKAKSPAAKLTEPEPEPVPDAPRPERATPAPDLPKTTPSPARSAAQASPMAASPSTSTRPAAASTSPARASSSPTSSTQSAPSSGLYYSSGTRKAKDDAPLMKTTPSPLSTPAPTSRPTNGAPIGTAASTRPASMTDYRANIDRQAREQKSVGGIIAMAVYTLIGLFVLGTILAGYGAYAFSKQLHQQSLNMTDLDNHYAAQDREFASHLTTLDGQITSTDTGVAQLESDLRRQQEVIVKQQDTINALIAQNNSLSYALKTERQGRFADVIALRARIHSVEEQQQHSSK